MSIPTPEAQPPSGGRVRRKVVDIPPVIYAAYDEAGTLHRFEPSRVEIQEAIDNGQLEPRGFQSHNDELHAEWAAKANGDVNEYCRQQRLYHARRIAHFVVHGWTDPIRLNAKGEMDEGLHRLKAAQFNGMTEVEVIISN